MFGGTLQAWAWVRDQFRRMSRRMMTRNHSLSADPAAPNANSGDDERLEERREMVNQIALEARDTARWTGHSVFSPRVMAAMAKTPRHYFVPPQEQSYAYMNGPLPIGFGQTISQPYIVALMTELADVSPTDVVLEVGTGCGYQTAILAELVATVYTLELVPELAEQAKTRLQRLGYDNVHARVGDGYQGWEEQAPFNAVIVTAAADEIPPALVSQLAPGARLVIPCGGRFYGQELLLVCKDDAGAIEQRSVLPVSFVPLRHPS